MASRRGSVQAEAGVTAGEPAGGRALEGADTTTAEQPGQHHMHDLQDATAASPRPQSQHSDTRRASLSESPSDTSSPRLPSDRHSVTLITSSHATPKQIMTTMELTYPSSSPISDPHASPDASSLTSGSSPWVGITSLDRTSTAALGKSGRVIERLMAENDRLRREMRSEMAKREELSRAASTARPKLERLESECARLANVKSVDDGIIRRRDRKIEELRAELETERTRRLAAEERAKEAERTRDEAIQGGREELGRTKEEARHASVHADILMTSHAQLAREYRQRIAGLSKSLRDLEAGREEDRKRLTRLDVVAGQMRSEAERMRKVNGELVGAWQRFEEKKNLQVESIEDGARKMSAGFEEKERETVKLAEDMVEVMGRMKWVINMDGLDKASSSANNSPPPLSPKVRDRKGRKKSIAAETSPRCTT